MAFTLKTVGIYQRGRETVALVASGTAYSSALPAAAHAVLDTAAGTRKIVLQAKPSAVSGTNLDVALYGADDEAGTDKYLLLDAVIADLTTTAKVSGIVDLNLYPAPFYFVGFLVDADESANTVELTALIPPIGSR